jgi:hypothetical protein
MTGDGRATEPIEAPFLTKELRTAFEEAARDDDLWGEAKADPDRYLEHRGVPPSDQFSVAFLDVEREGDTVRFLGGGGVSLLEMYCPPQRTWWSWCRKVMRVCEKRTVLVDGEAKEVDVNCYFVCEESIWEPEFTLPTRPPFPPLPLRRSDLGLGH